MDKSIKSVLITGATGFLGSHLTKCFLNLNYRVIILIRSSSNLFRIKDYTPIPIIYNIDKEELSDIFHNEKPDIVIHSACNYGKENTPLIDVIKTNLVFGLDVFEQACLNKTNFFINIDTSLPKTINNYSLSKAQFKEWLKLDSRIKISNIRIDLIYGANDNQNTFLSKLINSMKSNSKQKIKLTSGLQKRDFIYVTDVVDAIKIIVKKEHLLDHYSEIDITTGRFVMVKDFIEKIISKLESKSQILIKKRLGFGEISYRNDEIMEPSLSGSFIKAFGWTPKVTHEEGILKILEQYK